MVERKECERLGLGVEERKNGENHDKYWIIVVGPPKIGLQLDFSAGINP